MENFVKFPPKIHKFREIVRENIFSKTLALVLQRINNSDEINKQKQQVIDW